MSQTYSPPHSEEPFSVESGRDSHAPTVFENREAPAKKETVQARVMTPPSLTSRNPSLPTVTGGDEKGDPYLVQFEPGDPANPLNWSRSYRWFLTVVGGVLALNATFASAAPANIVPEMGRDLGFGDEVGALVVAIFVGGYCVGPILWGPLSEHIGRRPVFIISFIFYTGFQVGCSLSRNIASIIIFRLLGGIFAAATLTNSGAIVSDMWDAKTRGKGLTIFAVAPFGGPALGPVVAGWISVSGVSWRWLFWTLTIFAGVCTVVIYFFMVETYAPIILKYKAERLRKETGDNQYYAPIELDKMSIGRRVNKILALPFQVLFQEPVLIALTVYMSFMYGCLYLLFEAYPIVFTMDHHLNAGVSGLMFLPISVGGAIGCLIFIFIYVPRYERFVEEYAPAPVPPEKRLEVSLVAAPLYAAAFFWFGWTSYSFVSFWSPLLAGGLMGLTILLIFLSLLNYIVDMYLFVAASALAANTVVRSIFGAVFPLFARQMFDALNPRWASTLLGCFALLMVPIPFMLVRYGPYLRSKSKFAPHRNPPAPAPVPEKSTGEV